MLLCLNFLALALMRNGLGMAMVCMVNNTALQEHKNRSSSKILDDTDCPMKKASKTGYDVRMRYSAHFPNIQYESFHDFQGEFLWDNTQQGMLFAAIYWGSITSLPAGWLSDRYSPRHLLLFSVILNVICSFLTPVAAMYGGYIPMFIVRVFMGTGQVSSH
jgi:MFS transporter, ACS family, solute carrier family 17 (sodium-dependent inorganic phosphate cotransporter), other